MTSKDFEDEQFIILTAREKGTCIEMVGNRDRVLNRTATILNFIKIIIEKINKDKQ